MIGRVFPQLCFFLSIALTTRQLVLAAAASSSKVVTSLPGFPGRLPFHLETGYVEVDEENGTELFYYFVESEAGGENDPFLLWLTGGDHCSVLSSLALEIGPFQFVEEPYNGTVPSLAINPYSWTKVANILFVDTPVGAGFSFSRQPEGYDVGEVSTSLQLHELLIKWFTDHPEFVANPLYIGGDSFAGKIVPFIAQKISEGVEAGRSPLLNLKGYLVGNPATGESIDESSKVPFAHGFGIIPDQLYETILGHCQGEDYKNPTNALCANSLGSFYNLLSEVMGAQILLDKCTYASGRPGTETDSSAGSGRKILSEETGIVVTEKRVKNPPPRVPLGCISYTAYLSYFWANDELTRGALGIKKGTVDEWVRCRTGDMPYNRDIESSIKYHRNVTTNGYRALVYSGDHDSVVPHLGTQAWVRSLGYPIVDDWRAWHLHGQSAGFTISYSNNMTFATVKGAGHTAPQYEPQSNSSRAPAEPPRSTFRRRRAKIPLVASPGPPKASFFAGFGRNSIRRPRPNPARWVRPGGAGERENGAKRRGAEGNRAKHPVDPRCQPHNGSSSSSPRLPRRITALPPVRRTAVESNRPRGGVRRAVVITAPPSPPPVFIYCTRTPPITHSPHFLTEHTPSPRFLSITERTPHPMASGAAANGFGRNWLKEREARLLHEAGYPCPPGMKLPGGGWRLSQMGIPIPPIPTADRRWAEIYAVRDELTAEQQEDPAWHPENSSTWVPFFEDRHERQLNDFPGPKDLAPSRNNSEGRKDWWGLPGRSLQAVLDHIEGGNEPPLQGPARRGRRHGWEPRRMACSSSSSSDAGARSSTPLASVIKQEPAAPSRGIVIREPGTGGGSGSSSRLLTPKREPGTGVVGRALKKAFRKKAVVKEEPYNEEAAMAAALAASLDDVPPAPEDFACAWSAREHEREEEERKRRVEAEQREAFERYGRRSRRASPEVVVLDDDDEEAGTSTSRWLTPKQEPGTGGDGEAGRVPAAPPSYGGGGNSDDGEDYTVFYSRLGL